MPSLLFFLVSILGSILLLSIIEAVYNIFIHPLRQYPGPFLARVNRLSFAYHSWNGDIVERIKQLHEEYGDVVRIAPNELSYISGKAWQDIMGHPSSGGGNLPRDLPKPNAKQTIDIMIANDEDHRRLRKVQLPMFSEKALFSQEPYITSYVDKLISKLRQCADRPETATVDLANWYNFTTFDILGNLAFGDSFGCLESGIMHPWITAISRSIKDRAYFEIAKRFPSPIFKLLRALQPQELKASARDDFYFASQKARERINQGETNRNDFMSYILKHNDEKGMTPEEIEANAAILVTAGSETTATFLSGITYYLLRSPSVLEELTRLIRTTFPFESDITIATVQKLDFFTACLTEGLRIYPPVPSGVPRITTREGNVICDRYVAPNTTVYVTQLAAYHSTRNFTNPELFVPERWMDNLPTEYIHDKREVFQPFSVGPRNCIGRKLAYAEMRLILARVLWNFDLELQPESQAWASGQKIWKLWEKPPLMIRLIPRKH